MDKLISFENYYIRNLLTLLQFGGLNFQWYEKILIIINFECFSITQSEFYKNKVNVWKLWVIFEISKSTKNDQVVNAQTHLLGVSTKCRISNTAFKLQGLHFSIKIQKLAHLIPWGI